MRWVARREDFNIVDIAIGVTYGEVFIGNVGSSKRFDYTVLGTPINLARRLCSYADSDQIMVTRQLSESIGRKINFKPVEYVYLVGFCDPVEVCQVEMSQQGVTHEAA
jgi:adenylate cyclase